ncbi:hypothetical protein NC653_040476 [Populus alba x Populus x berolinensis]|uniref:MYB transcription factor n=1 Tax=Populus alba x Populus x berolinensis TaxID=444605 RepID=A0AAD6PMU2_9ROSI|nr:hypothetical protein NC653_040476 [Populus alba x Populus x berolinensis]
MEENTEDENTNKAGAVMKIWKDICGLTEWTREEDEKLLHLAKLMPTQWRNDCTYCWTDSIAVP